MRVVLVAAALLVSSQAFAEEWTPFVVPAAATDSTSQIDRDSIKYPDAHVIDYWIRTKPASAPDTPESYTLRHTVADCSTRKVHFSTISQYQGETIEQHLDVTPAVVYAPGLPAGDYFTYCKSFWEIWK